MVSRFLGQAYGARMGGRVRSQALSGFSHPERSRVGLWQ